MADFIGGMIASLVLGTMLLIGGMYQLSIESKTANCWPVCETEHACTTDYECEVLL